MRVGILMKERKIKGYIMNKYLIVKINDVEYTLIKHEDIEVGEHRKNYLKNNIGGYEVCNGAYGRHIETLLPALPANPKESDISLLYAYCMHGLYPVFSDGKATNSMKNYSGAGFVNCIMNTLDKITHAETFEGERVEISIIKRRGK